jgi:hypothetical protein
MRLHSMLLILLCEMPPFARDEHLIDSCDIPRNDLQRLDGRIVRERRTNRSGAAHPGQLNSFDSVLASEAAELTGVRCAAHHDRVTVRHDSGEVRSMYSSRTDTGRHLRSRRR